MQQPPLLPEETLMRVLRLARLDGLGLLVLGSIFALMAAAGQEGPFAAIGLLAAGAGAIELHGVGLLREGEPRGMDWVIASQPFLLLVIWCYAGLRLLLFEIPPLPEGMGELAAVGAAQWGLSIEAYFERVNTVTAAVLSVVALGYQGGMTIYYLRRRRPVIQAFEQWAEPIEPGS
jgi:hypothetical protein